MNCSYFDLFCNHDDFILKEESGGDMNRLFRKLSRIMRINAIDLIKYRHIFDDRKIRQLMKNSFDFNQLFELSSILIKTNNWFYTADHGRFLMPDPNDEIKQRVEYIISGYPEKISGIHIRRGDNIRSTNKSTDDLFKAIIEKEIRDGSSTHFFLSTDSEETEELFLKRYPGLIFLQSNKSFDRSTPDSAKDAFVDMLCLSRTKKIYGSYWSSFSAVASSISGSEFATVEPGLLIQDPR
jgi:hypothetical protein